MLSKSRTSKSLFRRNVYSLVRDYSFRITAGSPNSGETGLPAQAVAPTPVSPIRISTIFAAAVRLQEWMDEPSSITSMTEQDRQISEIIAEERSRLRNFIRRRVPDPSDV